MLPDHQYCNQCGAKYIDARITVKYLILSLLASFGWDSHFFVTFRDLMLRPQLVFEKYLAGTRKRYTNPFTFFAVGTALSVLVLGFWSDHLIGLSTKAGVMTSETLVESLTTEEQTPEKSAERAAFAAQQEALNAKAATFMFKYYNYLSFLFLPIYTLVALLVYGKPNTYGEHLVINAYIQGLLMFIGLLLFAFTMLLQRDIFMSGSIILNVLVYLYAYKKYRKHSLGRTIGKFLRFIGIVLLFGIIMPIIGFLLGKFIVG